MFSQGCLDAGGCTLNQCLAAFLDPIGISAALEKIWVPVIAEMFTGMSGFQVLPMRANLCDQIQGQGFVRHFDGF